MSGGSEAPPLPPHLKMARGRSLALQTLGKMHPNLSNMPDTTFTTHKPDIDTDSIQLIHRSYRLNLGIAEYPSLLSLTVRGYPQVGWLGPGGPAYALGWHDSDTWHYQGSQCPAPNNNNNITTADPQPCLTPEEHLNIIPGAEDCCSFLSRGNPQPVSVSHYCSGKL